MPIPQRNVWWSILANQLLQERVQKGFVEQLDESKLLDCMRCGFCLPACPTYIHSNYDESQSPRGRIALMKAVREGYIPFDGSVEEALDLCLGCRACEIACPAGVEYGYLLEKARNVIQQEKKISLKEKAVRHIAFDHLFKEPKKIKNAVSLVRFYQRSGLQAVTRKSKVLNMFPVMLREMEGVLPKIDKYSSDRGKSLKPEGKQKLKVAFFTGCLMETIFSKTNDATIKLLQKLGCEILVPENQVCCGALQGHSGELERAKINAKRNIDQFLEADVDYIVNNAGGCGAFLSEYENLLKDYSEYYDLSKRFSEKIIDISSLLYKLGITSLSLTYKEDTELIVTYQDSCHLRNVNKVINEPREILKSIQNVQFVELEDADMCCGSAGVYNLIHSEMSTRILDEKMDYVRKINPQIIITTNPGCLLQMKVGIERAGLSKKVEALHLVDFIHDYISIN